MGGGEIAVSWRAETQRFRCRCGAVDRESLVGGWRAEMNSTGLMLVVIDGHTCDGLTSYVGLSSQQKREADEAIAAMKLARRVSVGGDTDG